MIEIIALGMAALALILGFMGTTGVSDLKRELEGEIKKLQAARKILEARTSDLSDRAGRIEKAMKAKTDVEFEEIAVLKMRMDKIEAPKPAKKAKTDTKTKRGSNGRFTKKDK